MMTAVKFKNPHTDKIVIDGQTIRSADLTPENVIALARKHPKITDLLDITVDDGNKKSKKQDAGQD